ncbi:hypothetical protein NECAME_16458 [Necator americanus]|uniref:Receptor L-domain domain-containing protein n=1 Tax=Necator americanus TaxID=51031 RepID=W2TWA7_NECAM|nr:hypothetical protein NECAME_16458 [Necator americanus]ETN86143.1 hypothetical protein NECAME_16458 [Necator americanus]
MIFLLLPSFYIATVNLLLTTFESINLPNFGRVRDLAIDGLGIVEASNISLNFAELGKFGKHLETPVEIVILIGYPSYRVAGLKTLRQSPVPKR